MPRIARILKLKSGNQCVVMRKGQYELAFHFHILDADSGSVIETSCIIEMDNRNLANLALRKRYKPTLLNRAEEFYLKVIGFLDVHGETVLDGKNYSFNGNVLDSLMNDSTDKRV